MDEKILYLVKSLSRTKRKDYENYVVNAIWNRIKDERLIPVTQQYVCGENGERYFIDLYFPQLKIGIECDEGYHNRDKQRILDRERELTIFDVLRKINQKDYRAIHIDMSQSYENIEKQIDECVSIIKSGIEEQQIVDGWAFLNHSVEDYFANKDYITIYDDIAFKSNKDIFNVIFGQRFKGSYMQSGVAWDKLYTKYHREEGLVPWFPQLRIDKPTTKGYYNVLSHDGTVIQEFNDSNQVNLDRKEEGRYIGQKRVVFTKVKNSTTGKLEYRFAGIFIGEKYTEQGAILYRRIDDKFEIIRDMDD